MFNNLRKKVLSLPEDQLNQKFQILTAPSICKRSRLPDWWIPILHDKALLKGVDKHGFGKWDTIFTDPDLGFSAVVVAKLEEKKAEKNGKLRYC